MEYICTLCEKQGNSFGTDDGKEMKFHNATKHLHLYVCPSLICPKKFTTENAVTNHYKAAHNNVYKKNKNKTDAEIKNMGKLINKELRAAEKEAEAAAEKEVEAAADQEEV